MTAPIRFAGWMVSFCLALFVVALTTGGNLWVSGLGLLMSAVNYWITRPIEGPREDASQ